MDSDIFGPDDLDDDGILDCCILEEIAKEKKHNSGPPQGGTGCLGVVVCPILLLLGSLRFLDLIF